ncbi:MAG: ABC transporter permease [Cyanobacteria bacterium J06642_2]
MIEPSPTHLTSHPEAVSAPQLGWWLLVRRALARQPLLGPSLTFIVLSAVVGAGAPSLQAWGWLRDPTVFLDYQPHLPPSTDFWMGTTSLGHDVWARVLFGARAAWQTILAGTSLALVLGIPLGLLSGYSGGWVDRVLVFAMDTIYTLPGLLLAIVVSFVLGPGIGTAAVAVAIAYSPLYFRVLRSQTASLKSRGYVEAAIAAGAPSVRVLTRHIFPNVLPSLPVLLTLNAADAILITAALGFLGLGLPEDIPEWGRDLRLALEAFSTGEGIWWTAVFPGLAIALSVTALSWVGDALTDD